MQGMTIIDIKKPQTQTVEAVKSLLAWRGRAVDPLPSFIEMGEGDNRLVLVLSNKRDAYYTVTQKECSCPARNWHHNGPCKHMRRYFTESKQTAIKQPNTGRWHGNNGPVLDEVRPAAKAPSLLSVIDCHDSTDMDAVYHSIKADREMWPAEV